RFPGACAQGWFAGCHSRRAGLAALGLGCGERTRRSHELVELGAGRTVVDRLARTEGLQDVIHDARDSRLWGSDAASERVAATNWSSLARAEPSSIALRARSIPPATEPTTPDAYSAAPVLRTTMLRATPSR